MLSKLLARVIVMSSGPCFGKQSWRLGLLPESLNGAEVPVHES